MQNNLIAFLPETKSFFLHSAGTTYAFRVHEYGYLAHLYWGPNIATQDLSGLLTFRRRCFTANPVPEDRSFSLDNLPQEYPFYGNSDFRTPAIEVSVPNDGSRIVDLRYAGHTILSGKPSLEGLPSTYVENSKEAQTLVIEMRDVTLGLSVELYYTAFARHPIITRSVRVINNGPLPLFLRRVLSCSVDFPSTTKDYHFLQLSGTWARERDLVSTPLRPGVQSVESRRGTSSPQHNPFIALAESGTSENHGEVFGFNLVYSGNFLASVETDYDSVSRAQIGINPFDFSWKLEPEETFQAPEVVQVFSGKGLGGMSRALHRFYRKNLCRGPWRDKARPILINNWEATYFDFDAEKLASIAKVAGELGIELFVLDDGWFGRRNDDTSSLGDWVVNQEKLPGGLGELAARLPEGMLFGLWAEPEMVSPESDLYREHPDWCLHVPGRPRTTGRCQLVLDLSRPEVREEIFQRIARIFRQAPVSYVKWDMNRHMTEIGSAALPPDRQQETAHRYMLGLYALMERFTREFPNILFEGCSGGGGRFDPGILCYMPHIWTSDNSDAIARLRIQYGTSLTYPMSSMAAHISAVPNHQVGRTTPQQTRGHVAFTGAFGCELDIARLNEEELLSAKEQIALYKQIRDLLLEGDLYRLRSPFESNESAWMVLAEDKEEALVTHVTILATANPARSRLKLQGLDPNAVYRVDGTEETFRGDFLMHAGLSIPTSTGDFASHQWHLVRVH